MAWPAAKSVALQTGRCSVTITRGALMLSVGMAARTIRRHMARTVAKRGKLRGMRMGV